MFRNVVSPIHEAKKVESDLDQKEPTQFSIANLMLLTLFAGVILTIARPLVSSATGIILLSAYCIPMGIYCFIRVPCTLRSLRRLRQRRIEARIEVENILRKQQQKQVREQSTG